MIVGILRMSMALPADTLKEKRTIVRSVVERLRTRFNAAVAEVEDLDNPGRTTVAVACISNDVRHADSQLQAIADAIQEWRLDVEILAIETETLTL